MKKISGYFRVLAAGIVLIIIAVAAIKTLTAERAILDYERQIMPSVYSNYYNVRIYGVRVLALIGLSTFMVLLIRKVRSVSQNTTD